MLAVRAAEACRAGQVVELVELAVFVAAMERVGAAMVEAAMVSVGEAKVMEVATMVSAEEAIQEG
jgi:hypothetical protein